MEAELQRMEALQVISKIEEPTEWCSPMVVVPKPNGTVQICVDLTKLNESVQRERLLLPSVEQTLHKLMEQSTFPNSMQIWGSGKYSFHPNHQSLQLSSHRLDVLPLTDYHSV